MKFLFWFFFILFALILLWHLLTRKYVNTYKLYLLFGKKGCGKSTMLQKLAVYYKKRGFNVYCNIGDSDLKQCIPIPIQDLPELSLAYKDISVRVQLYRNYYKQYIDSSYNPGKELEKNSSGLSQPNPRSTSYSLNSKLSQYEVDRKCLTFLKSGKLPADLPVLPVPLYVKPQSVILCDEINLLWDNRDFKSFPKDMQKYFRLQRHYKHIFIGFSQTYDCDKKIRDLADYLLIVRTTARVWIHAKAYVKKVVVVSPEDENNRETATMTDDFIPLGLFYNLTSQFNAWLPKWVKLHDSFK